MTPKQTRNSLSLAILALSTVSLQATAGAPQPQPKQMTKIGQDEIVSMEAGKMFTQAQECLNNKQFDEAIDLLKQFLAAYPNSTAARYKYGYALLQLGKDPAALEQAKRCTELKPNFFGGWALYGEASMNLKLDDQAKEAYQKALAIESTGENADIIREHLNDLAKQKEPASTTTTGQSASAEDKQVSEQNRIIMKLNSALALCNQANELLKQKQFAVGLAKCREALKIAPEAPAIKENTVVYLNNYAADCVQKQDLKQAEVLMKEALALQSKGGVSAANRKTTLRNYSALLKFLGRNDEAKQIDAQLNAVGI